MVSFPAATVPCRCLRLIVLTILVMVNIPVICEASTPPVQPSLIFNSSPYSSTHNESLNLTVDWTGYVSYNIPPEYIIVEAFNMTDGSKLGAFSVSRQNGSCRVAGTCMYSTIVSTGNFPSGQFMLVATDPLSGASVRQQVTISTGGGGNRDFFRQYEQDQVFILVSCVLAFFLVAVLTSLVGKRT